MMKLLKYEFLRRKKLLVVVLMILVFVEAAIVAGLYLGDSWLFLSLALTFVLLIGGLLFPFIDAIVNYYSDFKNKHGYMLFLTPNSGHKIIGAKSLFLFCELVAMVALIVGAFSINYQVVQSLFPSIINPIISEMSVELLVVFGIQKLTLWTASPLLGIMVLQYFTNIMLAILAITIAKTLLSNKDFNWLFAVLFYFGLAIAMQFINAGMLVVFGFAKDIVALITVGDDILPNIIKYLTVASGMYIVWISVCYYVSGLLLSKRTDL